MDTAVKKFIASPTMDKLLDLRKSELLEVAGELGFGDVKQHHKKSVIRKYIGIHFNKASDFSDEELKQLSDDASSAGQVTPLQIEKLKLDYEMRKDQFDREEREREKVREFEEREKEKVQAFEEREREKKYGNLN